MGRKLINYVGLNCRIPAWSHPVWKSIDVITSSKPRHAFALSLMVLNTQRVGSELYAEGSGLARMQLNALRDGAAIEKYRRRGGLVPRTFRSANVKRITEHTLDAANVILSQRQDRELSILPLRHLVYLPNPPSADNRLKEDPTALAGKGSGLVSRNAANAIASLQGRGGDTIRVVYRGARATFLKASNVVEMVLLGNESSLHLAWRV
ncbi:hypothetical protein BKA70DRAFT_1218602 [Coprinopsis sp. MPI-PUGE-AT-0042]|nr:hypothetical protein BKA70DRAFT_1218602 [Coprinopsis sp. MPI-PUGE-AT-0042]